MGGESEWSNVYAARFRDGSYQADVRCISCMVGTVTMDAFYQEMRSRDERRRKYSYRQHVMPVIEAGRESLQRIAPAY